MSVSNLSFHSYFSVYSDSNSNAINGNTYFNPFDGDNYSAFSHTSVSSDEIHYSTSTGRITFNAAGSYLIVFDTPVQLGSSGATSVTGDIRLNGSSIYTSISLYANVSVDPRSYTFVKFVEAVKGDYLEVFVKSDSGSITAAALQGSYLTIFKAHGDYGHITYDNNGNNTTGARFIGDSDFGGTVSSTLKNVTFTSSTGKLTPANSKDFLMIVNSMVSTDSTINVELDFTANSSEVADTLIRVHGTTDPYEANYAIIKNLTGGQTSGARVSPSSGTVNTRINKGTSFSIIDLDSSTAKLSLACGSDSKSQSSGEVTCFDSANWQGGSISEENHITAVGITYAESGGTFTVTSAGKYLIYSSIVINASNASTKTYKLIQNSTTIWTSSMYQNTTWTPQEKTICLVVDAAAGDSFKVNVSNVNGTFDSNSAFVMFKVDDFNDLTITTSDLDGNISVTDDYTINTFTKNRLSDQYNRVNNTQVPFVLGTPGPLSLRAKSKSSITSPGDSKK